MEAQPQEGTCQCLLIESTCQLHFIRTRWSLLRQCIEESYRLMDELEEAIDDCEDSLEAYQAATQTNHRPPDVEDSITSSSLPRSSKKRARQSKKGDNFVSRKQVVPANIPSTSRMTRLQVAQATSAASTLQLQQPFQLLPDDFPPL